MTEIIITAEDKAACAERELTMRQRSNAWSRREKCRPAWSEHEIECMKAIVKDMLEMAEKDRSL